MPQVMDGIQHATQHFAAFIQMMQISAGELFAGVTVTARIQRRIVVFVNGVADLDYTAINEKMTISRIARWHNVVEHIDAALDTRDKVLQLTHPHPLAWLILWHLSRKAIPQKEQNLLP